MLGFYLSNVVIWMIIIYSAVFLCKDKIREKMAASGVKSEKSGFFGTLVLLFVLAAIPVIRLIILISIIYMAVCSQEEFEELMNKNKKVENDGQTY